RRIDRPSVDLPQPDSPTRPSVSPWRIVRSTPSTALTCATVRCSTPAEIGNHVRRPRMSTSGSAEVQALVSWGFVAVSGMGLTLLAARGGGEHATALGHPAGGALGPAHRLQPGRLLDAALHAEGAAGVERAAAGQVAEVGGQALDGPQHVVLLGVQ